jgi:glycosyltransferase involved in cell wall biosynthesis
MISSNPKNLPPTGKRGWPWDIVTDNEKNDYRTEISLPRISIVTPSYNQGGFLEATIRSVILQSYPNLEYFVIDGGSTDESLDIIRKYKKWIDYWVSEEDRGQSHAINKGFGLASGTLLGWLNSDDLYMPGTLLAAATAWRQSMTDVISGNTIFIDEEGHSEGKGIRSIRPELSDLLRIRKNTVPQQSTFWTRSCWERFGPLEEKNHYSMDWELWIKMVAGGATWTTLP